MRRMKMIVDQIDALLEMNKKMEERLIHIEDKVDRIRNSAVKLIDSENIYNSYKEITDKYDFGIIGMWYTHNYGASLTSYAMYRLVEKMGYKPLLLDVPEIGNNNFEQKDDSFDRAFMKKNCHISGGITIKSNSIYASGCKAFIVGSDSMFGGGYEYQIDKLKGFVLGEFAYGKKPIMSFSTSFGGWTGEDNEFNKRKLFSLLLKEFVHVSFREERSVDMCKELFDVDGSWTLDPVFLIDKKEYENISAKNLHVESAYVLVYLLKITNEKLDLLEKLRENWGKHIIIVTPENVDFSQYISISEEMTVVSGISIEDWLAYFSKADYIVTDSYHGMCFSIIFNKQFIALSPRDGFVRFSELARYLGIEEKVGIGSWDKLVSCISSDIDYGLINSIIKSKKKNDIDELENSLKNTINRKIVGSEEKRTLYDEIRRKILLEEIVRILS